MSPEITKKSSDVKSNPPAPSYNISSYNLKKKEIVEQGFHVMHLKGYNRTGVNEIIKMAGVSKGAFYYYFESKEIFAVEILKYYADKTLEGINKIFQNPQIQALKRIEKLYSQGIDNYNNKTMFFHGGFATKICQEIGDKHLTILNAANDVFLRIMNAHIECLREAQLTGQISIDRDIKKIAKIILYSWEGAILHAKANNNNESLYLFNDMLNDIILKQP